MRTGLWDRWGETLQVASKKCKAWSYFYVKSSVFGNKNIFPTLTVYRFLLTKNTQAKCFVMNQSTNEF